MSDDLDRKLAEIGERAPIFYHLGEFALAFAALEKVFHIMFDRMSGLDPKISRAVAGGMRLPDLTKLLTRIFHATETDAARLAEFNDLMQQTDDISKFRHAVIHVGVGGVDPHLVSASPMTARSPELAKVLKFKLADMKSATLDIPRIMIRLQCLHRPDLLMLRADQDSLYEPWLYKRIEPTLPC